MSHRYQQVCHGDDEHEVPDIDDATRRVTKVVRLASQVVLLAFFIAVVQVGAIPDEHLHKAPQRRSEGLVVI